MQRGSVPKGETCGETFSTRWPISTMMSHSESGTKWEKRRWCVWCKNKGKKREIQRAPPNQQPTTHLSPRRPVEERRKSSDKHPSRRPTFLPPPAGPPGSLSLLHTDTVHTFFRSRYRYSINNARHTCVSRAAALIGAWRRRTSCSGRRW